MSRRGAEDFRFESELWLWQGTTGSAWVFVTLPQELNEEIHEVQETLGPRKGFGSVKVEVVVGSSKWRTSVFPDKGSGCYVLPVKKTVRVAEDLEVGDVVTVRLVLGS